MSFTMLQTQIIKDLIKSYDRDEISLDQAKAAINDLGFEVLVVNSGSVFLVTHQISRDTIELTTDSVWE